MAAHLTNWASLSISFGSLLVAIFALVKNNRTQKLLAEIERSRRQDEELLKQSAELRAELVKTSASFRLILQAMMGLVR